MEHWRGQINVFGEEPILAPLSPPYIPQGCPGIKHRPCGEKLATQKNSKFKSAVEIKYKYTNNNKKRMQQKNSVFTMW
jgi:biotin synthase-related radical SAM superfamily protein